MEDEEEETEEDAIERLKTEIGDRYDEETGRISVVQVSDNGMIRIISAESFVVFTNLTRGSFCGMLTQSLCNRD